MTEGSIHTVSYQIKPAYTMNSKRVEVRDGWDVFVDGEWHERFRTQRQAASAVTRIRAREAMMNAAHPSNIA